MPTSIRREATGVSSRKNELLSCLAVIKTIVEGECWTACEAILARDHLDELRRLLDLTQQGYVQYMMLVDCNTHCSRNSLRLRACSCFCLITTAFDLVCRTRFRVRVQSLLSPARSTTALGGSRHLIGHCLQSLNTVNIRHIWSTLFTRWCCLIACSPVSIASHMYTS